MVSTIKAVLITFLYPCLQLLFLGGSMNSGLVASPKKKKQLYKLLPEQLFPPGVVFPSSYKKKSSVPLVEGVTAKYTSSFDWHNQFDAPRLYARLVSPDNRNQSYQAPTISYAPAITAHTFCSELADAAPVNKEMTLCTIESATADPELNVISN